MGEEIMTKEEEVKKSEDAADAAKKKEEESAVQEIVLKVDMHCEACARKVIRALHGFQGVEEVTADSKASKVVVKGGKTADPLKLCQRIQTKTGRKAEIISPLPHRHQEEQAKPQSPKKKEEQDQEPPKNELQPAPAVVTVVVLSIRMNCEACAQALRKRIRKIPGVEIVTTDLVRDQVIVKGVIDPAKIVDDVYKRTGKQVYIVKEEEKKEEEKKKDEQEQEQGEKKKEEIDEEKKNEIKKVEYVPSRYYTEFAFAYPSQMFSDENPNACSVM